MAPMNFLQFSGVYFVIDINSLCLDQLELTDQNQNNFQKRVTIFEEKKVMHRLHLIGLNMFFLVLF